jgi:hypothetical protein
MLRATTSDPSTPDTISWKLANDGSYSSEMAYAMQFLGQTNSCMAFLVWRPWDPPKCKTFAWLTIKNRFWTADRLQRRDWPNYGRCKLCNQVQESVSHLLFNCCFTIRVWKDVNNWLALNAMRVAYERWLAMMILEHLDEIGTRHDVLRFSPSRWR